MKINPTAILFWTFLALASYLFFGTTKAGLIGLTVGIGLSLLVDILVAISQSPRRYRK